MREYIRDGLHPLGRAANMCFPDVGFPSLSNSPGRPGPRLRLSSLHVLTFAVEWGCVARHDVVAEIDAFATSRVSALGSGDRSGVCVLGFSGARAPFWMRLVRLRLCVLLVGLAFRRPPVPTIWQFFGHRHFTIAFQCAFFLRCRRIRAKLFLCTNSGRLFLLA